MPKFKGLIGYGVETEVSPGVFRDQIVSKKHSGEMLKVHIKHTPNDLVTATTLSNTISIIPNRFMLQHYGEIRFVVLGGSKWSIASISYEPPRIVLTLGGVYNGN